MYSVQRVRGCRVVTGPIPINEMVLLMQSWGAFSGEKGTPDEWIIDAKLSQHINATMVCGTRRDTMAYRVLLGIGGENDGTEDTIE